MSSSKTFKIFIDGQAGTTGLEIASRLEPRKEFELITLTDAERKSETAKLEAFSKADVAILCLPDEAAKEIAQKISHLKVRLIDASTVHRCEDDWAYGIPELTKKSRQEIADAKKVSNPGCYASAAVLALRPLIEAGLLGANAPITINAVSGYSGGGKKMIELFQNNPSHNLGSSDGLFHSFDYRLDLKHKHLPEIKKRGGLSFDPLFLPKVDHFYRGMLVHLPLHAGLLKQTNASAAQLLLAYQEHFSGERFVRVKKLSESDLKMGEYLDPQALNNTNLLEIFVIEGAQGHVNIAVRLDNLGKGASGAAVQNLNLMLGLPEEAGLI
jgi:N-acetyl-gamma-glutamyl-phosphate reductase